MDKVIGHDERRYALAYELYVQQTMKYNTAIISNDSTN